MNRSAPRLRDFPGFFLFAVALLLCVGSSRAQVSRPTVPASDQATLHVETNLVVLPVRVTAPDGKFIDGLTREQFRVRENGRQQPITLFEREDTPVTVGLIVDHSRSMGPKLSGVAEAVAAFARSSNPSDEMFVVDFGDNVVVEMPGSKPFTSDPRDLQHAITAVKARGMTALYDAIAEGFNHVQAGRWDKKALIVVSDGGDNASGRKFADVLELARRSQVVIYAIGLVGATEEAEENPIILRRLCEETGGLAFFPSAEQSVSEISAIIAHDLREQYTIGFTLERTNGNAFRKIRVEVKALGRGKLDVRTRSGYFASLDDAASRAGRSVP